MWVKICANTNAADAQLAASLGADAVGFVFAASPRHMEIEEVAAITGSLPAALEKIGVFQGHNAEQILHAYHAAGLTGVQLHGEYDAQLVALLRREVMVETGLVTVLQTVSWGVGNDPAQQRDVLSKTLQTIAEDGVVDAVLVDSRTPTASGGTGIAFNWSAAAETVSNSSLKVIVAGGLRPENVARAIATLKPWGVDVASGSEASPGKKDPSKVEAFLRNAKL